MHNHAVLNLVLIICYGDYFMEDYEMMQCEIRFEG